MKHNKICERLLLEMASRYGPEKVVEILLLSVSVACITAVIAANLIKNKPDQITSYEDEEENTYEEYYE